MRTGSVWTVTVWLLLVAPRLESEEGRLYTRDSDGAQDGAACVARHGADRVMLEKGTCALTRVEAPDGGYRFEFRETRATLRRTGRAARREPLSVQYRLEFEATAVDGDTRTIIPGGIDEDPEGWQTVALRPGEARTVAFLPMIGLSGKVAVTGRIRARASSGRRQGAWLATEVRR
ncbi:MAG: hypothetical protein FJX77_09060 [Armatimonadetes bacterium]|nr:hypothetical protein [Armatimonadota bacterium]